jgi:hypothetical protein
LNDYEDHLKIANTCLTNYSDKDSYDARKKSILALLNNEKLCKKYIPGPIHTFKTAMKQYDALMLKLKGHLCLLSTMKDESIDMHYDIDQMYDIFNTCSIYIKSFIIKINFNLVMKELMYVSSFRYKPDETLFVDIGSFINRLDFRSLLQKLPEIDSFDEQKQYIRNILINHEYIVNDSNKQIMHNVSSDKYYASLDEYNILLYNMGLSFEKYDPIIIIDVRSLITKLINNIEENKQNLLLECVTVPEIGGHMLKHINPCLHNTDICVEAILNDINATHYVRSDLLTYELCLKIVKRKGLFLQYVPIELQTYDLCIDALTQNGMAIEFVYDGIYTNDTDKRQKIYHTAIKQCPNQIINVPKSIITHEMIMDAVKQNGMLLADVPQECQTTDICLEAIKQNGNAIKYVKKYIQKRIPIESDYYAKLLGYDISVTDMHKHIKKPWIRTPEKNSLIPTHRVVFENFQTYEMANIAVRYNKDNIIHIIPELHQSIISN